MRFYECVDCGNEYDSPPSSCTCSCTEFQAFEDGFDADELGIDPEVDAERLENA